MCPIVGMDTTSTQENKTFDMPMSQETNTEVCVIYFSDMHYGVVLWDDPLMQVS